MSLELIDQNYLDFYELFSQEMRNVSDDDRHHHVIIYHPDVYVKMAQENIKLKQEISRLKQVETKYKYEVYASVNLMDKLKYCYKELKKLGHTPPFRLDISPK